MPIKAVTFYTYRTTGGGWTGPQVGVYRFVRAIKKEPLAARPGGPDTGYLLVNGTDPKRIIRPKNADDAFDWYAEMAIKWIHDELGTLRVTLVPIPNSDCIQSVAASRTKLLADAIVKQAPVANIADVLRWSEKMIPAHKGGPRKPHLLHPKLRVRPTDWKAGPRPHVLIDDVSTSGGHIQACAAILKSRGANVNFAVAGAQAEQGFTGDSYEPRLWEHEDYEP